MALQASDFAFSSWMTTANAKIFLAPARNQFFLDQQKAFDHGVTPEELVEVDVPLTMPGTLFLLRSPHVPGSSLVYLDAVTALANMRGIEGAYVTMIELVQ